MSFNALPYLCILFAFSTPAHAQKGIEPDWSAQATIDPNVFPNGRKNIYQWDEATFSEKVKRGSDYALHYPVAETGILLPARPLLKILAAKPGDPLFALMKTLFAFKSDLKNFNGFWDWLGLTPQELNSAEEYPMGVSLIHRNGTDGFSLSCAACHSSQLFGKSILGMGTRFSRANLFFINGKSALDKTSPTLFKLVSGANKAEMEMFLDAREHMKSVGLKSPATLGLDTSLSQVALSLARRAPTDTAERTDYDSKNPRPNILDSLVADSKPAVWWNLKYKTHWLSDGSVISGNPVFTNFLWNEIGRGADLPKLLDWMKNNNEIIQDLTTAVFATEAPLWKDFLGAESIRVERAQRGEKIFNQSCMQCHGQYQKDWTKGFDTLRVVFHEQVRDVGTDSGRREGMRALAEGLNPLKFSRNFEIKIEEQEGYVPPPLVGIWARYPYLHNNSIPNLCALMTPVAARPKSYYSGNPIEKDRDFDQECVGYPLGDKTPKAWKKDEAHFYDTRLQGLSNDGHYEGIFSKNGIEKFSLDEKKDLIEFLKTL